MGLTLRDLSVFAIRGLGGLNVKLQAIRTATAIGSSLQIGLFVTPVLFFASYLFGQPMNLEFSLPEIAAVAIPALPFGRRILMPTV